MSAKGRGVAAGVIIGALAVGGIALGALLQPFGDGSAPAQTAGPPQSTVPLVGTPADQLVPGACIDAYTSAWEPRFVTVDCAVEHSGQFLADVESPEFPAASAYPGEDALRARAQITCQSEEVLDTAAASAVPGLVVEAAFALDEAEWDAGQRGYRCFAAVPGGGMTGSLALQ